MQCITVANPVHNRKLLKSSKFLGDVRVSRVRLRAPQKVGAATGDRRLVNKTFPAFFPIVTGVVAGQYFYVITEDGVLGVFGGALVAAGSFAATYYITPRPVDALVFINFLIKYKGVDDREVTVDVMTQSALLALSGGSISSLTNALSTKYRTDPESVVYISKAKAEWVPWNNVKVEFLIQGSEVIRMTPVPGVRVEESLPAD